MSGDRTPDATSVPIAHCAVYALCAFCLAFPLWILYAL